MGKLLLALGTCIVIVLLVGIFFRQTLKIPGSTSTPPSAKIVPPSWYSVWIPTWDEVRVVSSLERTNKKLSSVSPVWYILDSNGKLTRAESPSQDKVLFKIKQLQIPLLPTIFNQFDPDRVNRLVQNLSAQEEFFRETVKIAQEEKYQGWDIDFEEVNSADKAAFNAFMEAFGQHLHQNNLLLSVTVHAQVNGKTDRSAALAQDWSKLGNAADFVRIMAYDFHNPQTSPGAITPIPWYQQIIQRAVSTIPENKIIMGLPLYGYNWNNKKAVPIEYLNARELSDKIKQEFIRDQESGELRLNYTQNGQSFSIWVEDSQSVAQKVILARNYGIFRFSFWRLGGEDPDLWTKLP